MKRKRSEVEAVLAENAQVGKIGEYVGQVALAVNDVVRLSFEKSSKLKEGGTNNGMTWYCLTDIDGCKVSTSALIRKRNGIPLTSDDPTERINEFISKYLVFGNQPNGELHLKVIDIRLVPQANGTVSKHYRWDIGRINAEDWEEETTGNS